jgi:Myb-like DNA-binding protein REB1
MKNKKHSESAFGMSDPSENDVATIAAAVAAATEGEKASVAVAAAAVAAAAAAATAVTDEEDGTAGDWDNLTDNGGEEEEEGAQALLELRKQKRKNKKRKRKITKKKETDDDEENAEVDPPVKIAKIEADISVDDIAPELRDVDLPEEKRKTGNTETTNVSNNTATSNNASSSNNNDNTFETDLQEFFSHPDNPNWQRFYADSITDDAANQVDLNMLIEEQHFNSHQLKKRSKRNISNVDPALEQLDDDNSPLEMTTKEQSQLEDAMMHASAIVRTLESGGSQQNFDGILLNEKKKRKNSNSASYDDDLLNEAIKYARSNTELNFEDQGNGSGATDTSSANTVANPISSGPKTNKRKIVQGDLAAISVAKDPSLLNPMRNSLGFNKKDKDSISPVSSPASPPATNTSTAPSSTNTGVTSDSATAGGLMDDNNWRYVSLSGDSGAKNAAASAGLGSANHQSSLLTTDSFKRLNWTGNGNQHGGSFSQHEVDLIDEFMMRYCHMNNMTREDLCKRVWSNERRKDNFWDDVANILPTRTRASVYKHIRRAYHVFKARGKWTPEEDKELGDLVEEKGKLWKQIGLTLCRMPEDCRDRWRNYVKCGEKRVQNKWGVDEEERLREVVTHIMTTYPGHDINWTEVSDMMGGTRSRIQCRYKWTKMVKRAAMAKIDAMMPGDKISLLQFLKQSGYEDESQVDWDGFAALDSRGFWTGKELQVAFESQRAKILDGNNKDFRQVVDELLTELLILPEHRRREKYRGGFETDITGVMVNSMEQPSVDGATSAQSEDTSANNEKAGSTDPVKHEKKQKSQLELTDDLVAVAAAAAAAMQEDKKASTTVTSTGSITSPATSNGSVPSTSASAAIAAAALAKAKKRDTNNNIYGTPPTALLYKQSKKSWAVPGSTSAAATAPTITTSSSIPSSSATSSSTSGN